MTTVLVTGDVVVDHHLYCGEHRTTVGASGGKRDALELEEFGGAALV